VQGVIPRLPKTKRERNHTTLGITLKTQAHPNYQLAIGHIRPSGN